MAQAQQRFEHEMIAVVVSDESVIETPWKIAIGESFDATVARQNRDQRVRKY
jgi:hypothetical protein